MKTSTANAPQKQHSKLTKTKGVHYASATEYIAYTISYIPVSYRYVCDNDKEGIAKQRKGKCFMRLNQQQASR